MDSNDVPTMIAHLDDPGDTDISIAPVPVAVQQSALDRFFSPPMLLAVLSLVSLINYIDRGALAGMVPVIREPVLHCTDTEAGWLAGAFTVGYMVFAPIFSFAGKFVRPTRLMALGLLIWIISSLFAAWSRHFWPLLFARIGSGVGESSFAGLSPTCIDDNAPPEKRTAWLGIFYATMPVGMALGMALGGVFAQDWMWYALFYLEALVMLPLVIAVYLIPVSRSSSDREKRKLKIVAKTGIKDYSLWQSLVNLLTNPLYLLIILGYASYTFVVGSYAFWLPDFFVEVIGYGAVASSVGIGVVTVVCGIVGVGGGGWVLDKMGGTKGYRGSARGLVFSSVLSLTAIPLSIITFQSRDGGWGFMFIAITELMLFATQAPINASILTVVPSELRPMAMAIAILCIHAIGDFPSPIITGFLIDASGHRLRFALSLVAIVLAVSTISWGMAWWLTRRRAERERVNDMEEFLIPNNELEEVVEL